MISVKVLGIEALTNDVFVLKLEKPFDFVPGQLIRVSIPQYSERVYSIASGKDENYLAILFDVRPEGILTPKLSELRIDDSVSISDPFGDFICDNLPAYWIATGTGIAPFYSMLKSGIIKGKILIHGGRTVQSFYFQDDISSVMNTSYIRCCSKGVIDGFFNGRLTTYLKQQTHLPVNYKYYLCGNAEMVVDVRDLLISLGIPYNQIVAEIFF